MVDIYGESYGGAVWRVLAGWTAMVMLVGAGFVMAPQHAHAAAAIGTSNGAQGEAMSMDTRDVLAADGRAYRVTFAVPCGSAPSGGWPVAYVLGDEPLQRLLDYAESQADDPQGCARPQAILVGIGYPGETRRELDYTPDVKDDPSAGLAQPAGTGGAERFLTFIQSELQPMTASLYSVDVRRQILLGHSFGGLFVLDTLLKQPDAFYAYVSSSASVWWADRYLERKTRRLADPSQAVGTVPGVWMSIGEYEQSASPQEIERNEPRLSRDIQRRESRRMVDGNRELAGILADRQAGRIHFQVMAGKTHGSVVGPALYWGLQGALYSRAAGMVCSEACHRR